MNIQYVIYKKNEITTWFYENTYHYQQQKTTNAKNNPGKSCTDIYVHEKIYHCKGFQGHWKLSKDWIFSCIHYITALQQQKM